MEENNNPQEEIAVDPNACANCGKTEFEEGYTTKLCTGCRQQFVNYPIPKWLLGFAAGIAVLMVIGAWQMKTSVPAALHLSKGIEAWKQNRFKTAAKELDIALKAYPDVLEANLYGIIAYSYMLNADAMRQCYNRAEHRNVESTVLLNEVEAAIKTLNSYYTEDTSLYTTLAAIPADSISAFDTLVANYLDSHYTDVAARYLFADRLYDQERYTECEKVLEYALASSPGFARAGLLMAATKRQLGKYNEAIALCEDQINRNRENEEAVAQKVKIELKRKNDKIARIYATQAITMEPTSVASLEVMAMVNFYDGKKDEAQKQMKQIMAMEDEAKQPHYLSDRLKNLFDGTFKFRD